MIDVSKPLAPNAAPLLDVYVSAAKLLHAKHRREIEEIREHVPVFVARNEGLPLMPGEPVARRFERPIVGAYWRVSGDMLPVMARATDSQGYFLMSTVSNPKGPASQYEFMGLPVLTERGLADGTLELLDTAGTYSINANGDPIFARV